MVINVETNMLTNRKGTTILEKTRRAGWEEAAMIDN